MHAKVDLYSFKVTIKHFKAVGPFCKVKDRKKQQVCKKFDRFSGSLDVRALPQLTFPQNGGSHYKIGKLFNKDNPVWFVISKPLSFLIQGCV